MRLRYKTTSALSSLRHLPNCSSSLLRTPRAASRPFTTTTTNNNLAAFAFSPTAPKMKESDVKRNPHPDFKKVEASRPAWDRSSGFNYTQTADPGWKFGDGANSLLSAGDAGKAHVAIDPHGEGRPPVFNYKLLISGIVPRPIALVSTVSRDGKTTNLAPFSYFQVVTHDPPLFVVGLASGLEQAAAAKHTLHNLREGGECTISIISEHYVEAANSTSIDAPYGVSEWAVSGLTPLYDCETVRAPRVKEAVFSIEGKLDSLREFDSRSKPGKKSGTMAVIEGTRFWVREDAINEDKNLIDTAVLRPIYRLGGITYGRALDTIELPRPEFEKDLGGMEAYRKLEEKANEKNKQ